MKNYLFADVESHNVGAQYGMTPREFFRLGQYAWNDGPVVLTTDYDEMIRVIREADYVVGHNISSFDLSVLFGTDSLEPLQMALDGKVIDTFIVASLVSPAPYSYTDAAGHKFFDAAKPERAMRYLGLENLCHQFGIPGKFGSLRELAKKYNPPKTPVKNLDYGLISLDDEDFLKYAEQDVIAVRGLWNHLKQEISDQDYPRDYIWRELKIAGINAQITRNGILVDTDKALARVAQLAKKRDEVMAWLVENYDFPNEGRAPWATTAGKEVILKVLSEYGITEKSKPEWPRTPTGSLKLGGQDLIDLTEGTEAAEFGQAMATLKGQRSLAQLALDSTKEDGRVHPDVTCLQRSGRTSVQRPGLTVWTARGDGAEEKSYFVSDPGTYMVEMDFAAADARAVAAVSGDEEFAKRFAPGVDAHDLTGEIIFGHDEYFADRTAKRPVAKMCIAAGSPVLTDAGRVAIEDVTVQMKVWDGLSFVTHSGIVYNGEKEVITYDGVTATPDHIVFVYDAASNLVEVPFGLAAEARAPIATTGENERVVRVRDNHQPDQPISRGQEGLIRRGPVQDLQTIGVGKLPEPTPGSDTRVQVVCPGQEPTVPGLDVEEGGRYPAEVPEPEQPGVHEVRRPGDTVLLSERSRGCEVNLGNTWAVRQGDDVGSDRHQRGLPTRELEACHEHPATIEPEEHGLDRVPSGTLAFGSERGTAVSTERVDSGPDHRPRPGGGGHQGVALSARSGKVGVYDIRDTGPHHRFTVSGKLVHNCGHAMAYRIGARKLAENLGVTVEEAKAFIDNYKKAYPWVAAWQDTVTREGDKGFVRNAWGRKMVVDPDRSFTQSCALVGQGTTRECLFDGLLRVVEDDIENARWIRMTVHDAIVLCLPEARVEELAEYVQQKMSSTFDPGTNVSQPVEFIVGVGPLDATNWQSSSHG